MYAMSRLLHYYRFILGLFIARVTKLQTRTRDASSILPWISRPLECSILDTQDNNTVLSNTRRCASHTDARTHRRAPSPAPPRQVTGSAGARTRRRRGWRPAAPCGTSPTAGRGRWAAAGSWAAGPAAGGAWPAPSPPWSAPPSRSSDGSGWRGSRRCWCMPPPIWCSAGWTAPSGRGSWYPRLGDAGKAGLEIGVV